MKKHRNMLFKPLLIAVLISFSLTSCGKDDKKKAEEAQLDAVSASLSGTLTSYTGSQISLKTKEGESLTFDNCANAKLELKNGIVPGNEVLLVYVGALKDTDTSNVKVTKEGESLTFDNCANAKLELKNGIVPGNEVLLVYVGALKDTDTSNVKVRKIIVEENNAGLIPAKEDSVLSGSAASGSTYSPAGQDEPASGVKVEKTSGPAKEDSVLSGSAASGSTYSPAGQDEPASGVKVEKTSGTGTITGGVNVRSDAKSGSEILGHLSAGDSVTVTGICENGWYRIVFEEGTAFIWKDYVEYDG